MGYKARFNESRTFGVEIECYYDGGSRVDLARRLTERTGLEVVAEGYNHQVRNHWKITYDGSLAGGGVEIVSPILAGTIGLQQLEAIATAAEEEGCRVDRSCGLHVHHDVRDFDTKHFINLALLYVKLEGAMDTIMPRSRRSNNAHWCRTLRDGMGDTSEIVKNKMDDIRRSPTMRHAAEVLNGGNRYSKLNMEAAYRRQGTVEFRQHSGTVEAEKMIAWVKLTQNMVERAYVATNIKPQGTDNFDILIRFCPDRKTKAFYRKRQQHFLTKG